MSLSKPQVKRTYGCQNSRPPLPATRASQDISLSFSAPQEDGAHLKRKRPLTELFPNGSPPRKKTKSSKHPATQRTKDAKKPAGLTQLHFCIEESVVRTCQLCGLTYTRGALDDENLHKTHCSRVQRGMEWGREEDKEARKDEGASVVEEDVIVGCGERGRIIAVKPYAAGKLGSKVVGCLRTVNLALSAPDIPRSALEGCKVYLFLLRTQKCSKEKIVGCVVAQHISSAMEVARNEEASASASENRTERLIHVEGNLYCKPEYLPTPMGVARLFVSSAHRRKGIARALLSAVAKTFIHGHELDPAKGEVAFSQPTSAGRAVMESWGCGGVRIYKE